MKQIILSLFAFLLTLGVAAQDLQTDTATLETDFAPAVSDTLPVPARFSKKSLLEAQRQQERGSQRFMPTRRRINRDINKNKFAYKGEVMLGLTASYGTLSSDDTDILLILNDINADATIASIKPYAGYFYRDNNAVGIRFGYSHIDGHINDMVFDLGESNDTSFDIPYIKLKSNEFSVGVFHRSYAGLDARGHFALFAEFELNYSGGKSEFAYETGGQVKRTFSQNRQVKLMFNPGAAAYIFPNVCATISFGLGGIQYTSVTQKDADGNKIGSREASKMRFRLNIAAINIGLNIHLWDKKKD